MELVRFSIDPALRKALEPLILDALFEHGVRRGATLDAPMHLTMAHALEVLAAQSTRWQERLGAKAAGMDLRTAGVSRRAAERLHAMLRTTHHFFRREGAVTVSAATETEDREARFTMLWTDLFSRCLLDWLRDHDLIGDPAHLDEADTLVECAKLWVKDLAAQLTSDTDSGTFFLDAERDIQTTFERGPIKLRVRGRPDSLLLRPEDDGVKVISYLLGEPQGVALRVVQMLLNMAVIERTKGLRITGGSIVFFRAQPVDDLVKHLPKEVLEAFEHYVGNEPATLVLKKTAAAARKLKEPCIIEPCLIVGASGVGKTELARCTARALGVPLVAVHAGSIGDADDLVREVSESLEEQHLNPAVHIEGNADPTLRFPPMVLLLDDAQGLRSDAAWLQQLLSPVRRLRCADGEAHFPHASILAACTDVGKMPPAYAQKFRRIELEPCAVDDVARIVQDIFTTAKLELPSELAVQIARMGRCNPLRARLFASELRDRHTASPNKSPLIRETLMQLAGKHWKVDEHGLGARDYRYLQALESGPKGLPSLQQLLPTLADEFVMHIEPYLLQCGAIHRGPRGRALTVLGEQWLHRNRLES